MDIDDINTKKEREKARALRKTKWWQSELAKGVCHYCGKHVGSSALTMDHIVPVSRGGKSTKGNVVPCCKECNNNKKYYTPVELVMSEMEKNGELQQFSDEELMDFLIDNDLMNN